jgi:nucleotide-binding universal stress UspA family protein
VNTILVAYDDSEQSRRALDRASAIAEKFGSKVLVTSIVPLLHSAPKSAQGLHHGSTDPEEDVEHAHAKLQERGIDAETVTATGDPASAIAKLAADRHVDLVVVGTRELGTMRRLLGQSVSQAVSRRVHCDVLIVHPGPAGAVEEAA